MVRALVRAALAGLSEKSVESALRMSAATG